MNEQLRLDEEEVAITLRRLWNHALRLLATRVNKPTFEAHIRHLKPLALEETKAETKNELKEGVFFSHVITLGVPSAFTREWVEKRHAGLIQSILEEILDQPVQVKFTLIDKADKLQTEKAQSEKSQTDKTARLNKAMDTNNTNPSSQFALPLSDALPTLSQSVLSVTLSEVSELSEQIPPISSAFSVFSDEQVDQVDDVSPKAESNQAVLFDVPMITPSKRVMRGSAALDALPTRYQEQGKAYHEQNKAHQHRPSATEGTTHLAQSLQARVAALPEIVEPTLPTVIPAHPTHVLVGNELTNEMTTVLTAALEEAVRDQSSRETLPALTPIELKLAPEGARTSNKATGKERNPDAPLFNPRFTFENFVIGPSNRLAQAGAKRVAEEPGRVYNPLFLYGPPGLGKTHLMHAIGNTATHNGKRVAYISGEEFLSHFIMSLRENRGDQFRRRWNNIDVFLVDDVQFIAGKGQDRTKEEFFHTFNTLHQTGKQVVICSDRPPKELQMMDERLRSRFECGLVADIAPPDLETRLAILQKKAISEQARIPDDVLLYMAKLIQSNIRMLEGALVKLVAQASLTDSPVTTELAASILGRYYIAAGIGGDGESVSIAARKADDSPLQQFANDFVQNGGDPSKIITPRQIQELVARHFNLDQEDLMGKKRDKDVVMARQVAMHLTRELTSLSLSGIGNLFGRDHTTVMHACEKVRALAPQDRQLQQTLEDCTTQLRAHTMQ